MNKEEIIERLLKNEPSLEFTDGFLEKHPHAQLYLVGGALRDALLHRHKKEKDFDFVIRGLSAKEIEIWFAQQGSINLVGAHFGVFKFMPQEFSPKEIPFIDLSLPRTEHVSAGSLGGYKDFDVQSDPFLSIEEDLARRDFTINAMAYDVRAKRLIDPQNGQKDLSHKIIRAVSNPHERFLEDMTRMLRAIRFACELHFEIEEHTKNAIKELIGELNRMKTVDGKLEYIVPREMIGEELAKMFCANPLLAIKNLLELGTLPILVPEVDVVLKENPDYLKPMQDVRPRELTLSILVFLRALEPSVVHHTLRTTGLDRLPAASVLRIDTDEIIWIVKTLNLNLSVQEIIGMPASQFERWFMNARGHLFVRCLELFSQHELAKTITQRRKRIQDRWLVDHDETIAPLLSGNDVLNAGVPAGPQVRLWLDGIRDLQLDGRLMTREAALKWLREHLKDTPEFSQANREK